MLDGIEWAVDAHSLDYNAVRDKLCFGVASHNNTPGILPEIGPLARDSCWLWWIVHWFGHWKELHDQMLWSGRYDTRLALGFNLNDELGFHKSRIVNIDSPFDCSGGFLF